VRGNARGDGSRYERHHIRQECESAHAVADGNRIVAPDIAPKLPLIALQPLMIYRILVAASARPPILHRFPLPLLGGRRLRANCSRPVCDLSMLVSPSGRNHEEDGRHQTALDHTHRSGHLGRGDRSQSLYT